MNSMMILGLCAVFVCTYIILAPKQKKQPIRIKDEKKKY